MKVFYCQDSDSGHQTYIIAENKKMTVIVRPKLSIIAADPMIITKLIIHFWNFPVNNSLIAKSKTIPSKR